MQTEKFAEGLPIGRDFALKNRDIPEQTERPVWPFSLKRRAELIPTARMRGKFRDASSFSENSAI